MSLSPAASASIKAKLAAAAVAMRAAVVEMRWHRKLDLEGRRRAKHADELDGAADVVESWIRDLS